MVVPSLRPRPSFRQSVRVRVSAGLKGDRQAGRQACRWRGRRPAAAATDDDDDDKRQSASGDAPQYDTTAKFRPINRSMAFDTT